MFAVLKYDSSDVVEGHKYCCLLTDDKVEAATFIAERKSLSSNGRYTLHEVSSIQELSGLIKSKPEEPNILDEVLQKLEKLADPANAEKFATQISQETAKVMAEVKSMGIAGMMAVGDGFVALGDLIRKAGEEEKK